MAWLKVETVTPDKPEIFTIANHCGCTIGDAFLAWFRFYAWADTVTDDGFVKFLCPKMADSRGGLTGLGDALQDVGWITYSQGGAQIHNYERHNGKSAKKRFMDCERKRNERLKYVRIMSGHEADKKRTEHGQKADNCHAQA